MDVTWSPSPTLSSQQALRLSAARGVLASMRMTTNVSANDIHGIQSGWAVKSTDGHTLGTVEETTDTYILVKDGLINPTRHYLPAVHLAHVRPDVGEIGVDLTQGEFAARDWSNPNVEPPRWDVPIHEETDDETDPMRQSATRGPEHEDSTLTIRRS